MPRSGCVSCERPDLPYRSTAFPTILDARRKAALSLIRTRVVFPSAANHGLRYPFVRLPEKAGIPFACCCTLATGFSAGLGARHSSGGDGACLLAPCPAAFSDSLCRPALGLHLSGVAPAVVPPSERQSAFPAEALMRGRDSHSRMVPTVPATPVLSECMSEGQ